MAQFPNEIKRKPRRAAHQVPGRDIRNPLRDPTAFLGARSASKGQALASARFSRDFWPRMGFASKMTETGRMFTAPVMIAKGCQK
jgi:hypothetical protein